MPTSWYQVIPAVLEQTQIQNPRSILDVGPGFGKYGILARDVLEVPYGRYDKKSWNVRVDAVEAFSGYRNPVYDFAYDNVYYGDILDVLDGLPTYDMILLIDVLEHFPKEQGYQLLRKLKQHTAKCLLVSTPKNPARQDDYNGNTYERHQSRWAPLDFVEHDFSYRMIPIGGNGAQLICIWPNHNESPAGDPITKALSGRAKRPLSIGYVLPHRNLTGGLKMLLEQMRLLKARGHKVSAFRKGIDGEPVLPNWYSLEVDRQVLVPQDKNLCDYLTGCEVVMAGWIGQLPELARSKVPVVYWEQGHEWLFGETGDWLQDVRIRHYLSQCYSQPCHLAAVSPLIASILETKYGRSATVIPNGVDIGLYHPGIHRDRDSILLIGDPRLRFKAFDVALEALTKVWKAGFRFRVNWACQVAPNLANCDFPLDCVTNLSQEALAEYYRCSGIHLFASWYEGFGMPPLEAMASGIPVVATDCGGIRAYAEPGVNALLADPGDTDSLAAGLAFLLSHPDAATTLSDAGRRTAVEFSLDRSVAILEDYLMSAVG